MSSSSEALTKFNAFEISLCLTDSRAELSHTWAVGSLRTAVSELLVFLQVNPTEKLVTNEYIFQQHSNLDLSSILNAIGK